MSSESIVDFHLFLGAWRLIFEAWRLILEARRLIFGVLEGSWRHFGFILGTQGAQGRIFVDFRDRFGLHFDFIFIFCSATCIYAYVYYCFPINPLTLIGRSREIGRQYVCTHCFSVSIASAMRAKWSVKVDLR